ncbi:hypothetical protein JMJ35_002625 [Cladonia borealis]|uniref:ERT1/acuK family PAS domain-containing protein n=1 Tax=Cladonia borealis TaxID=184061 RepID=A0AA39UD82_9LECA|nr:hypothetical protein JMJ35_002625 [Cladonia borealis]
MASQADEDVPSRSHSESSDDSDSQDSEDMRKDTSGPRKSSDGKAKKPVNKDPNRVKRKKARRACENCQRAHLTCSDQRPCERCGDKKVCKDGKRKKAKYLDGTTDEDLIPVQEKEQEAQRAALNRVGQRFSGGAFAFPGAGHSGMYPGQQTTPSNFPMYPASGTQNQMTSPPFGNPLLPMTQQVTLAPYQQSLSSMPGFSGPLQPNPQMAPDLIQNAFSDGVWPPDFEMDNSDFANHYGRAEYHVLGHMSSRIGAGDSDPNESVAGFEPADGSNYAPGVMSTSYVSSPTASQQFQYSQPDTMQQEAIAYNLGGQGQEPFVKQEDVPGIGLAAASTTYVPSPASGHSPQGMRAGFEGNSTAKDMHTNISTSHQAQGLREPPQPLQQNATSDISPSAALPTQQTSSKPQTSFSRRSRNPSTIYNTVTEPYSYTRAFHDLMALIRKRFSQKRTAHIAKALASIRPSFISSLTKLDDDDRVFMEKCLQRTLLEYEDHLSLTGTPTILCRRTGEIVAINEGFSILTGWRKSVLLGKDPNFNVNKGGDAASSSVTGTSTSRGTNTPRIPDTTTLDDPRPKPVSIVELLDDESACDFFDDYAHLAFGDSRGSVRTPCKLLKYKTSKDAASSLDNEVGSRLKRQANGKVIGGSDGDKVECMLCWSVKRDVFDIPMLFVMNFLPCI